MHTDFTLNNFRIFDTDGACVPLRPITILTGCNNAGKSSIVKALCLLNDFCNQIKADVNDGRSLRLDDYKFDFQKFPNSLLGNFDMVRHHITIKDKQCNNDEESSENDNERIVFEAVVKSSWLLQDVILRLEFGTLEWDELNNGYLHAYSIRTLDGEVFFESKREGKTIMDFSIVKKSLLHFLCGQYAFTQWQDFKLLKLAVGYENEYSLRDKIKDDYFREVTNNILNDLGPTALVYLAEWQVLHNSGLGTKNRVLLLGKREDAFIRNAPSLGVYCYWPCLDYFKDMDKSVVIQTIKEKADNSIEQISSYEKEFINVFLDFFEKSAAESLHEFVGQYENMRYFVDAEVAENGFHYPDCFNQQELFADYYTDLSSLKELRWSAILISMDLINKLIMEKSESYLNREILYYHDEVNTEDVPAYKYEDALESYLKRAIEDIFVHLLPGSLSYSPTTIVRPQRMYSLEDNSDFSNTLKEYFEVKRLWTERSYNEQYIPCSFINKWISLLGIAHYVEIKSHAGGYGVTIHLYDTEHDMNGVLLADKGVGVLQLFAILLKIECAIIAMKIKENSKPYGTVGLNKEFIKSLRVYSQLYPQTIALEEPECHLHPSLQSQLADVFTDAHKQHGVHFLIESHSEYLIRKLQLNVAKGEIQHDDVSLIYVNSPSRPSYMPIITDIGVDTDGTLKNEFGKGFFDESIRLSNELFKIKVESDEGQA